MQPRAIKETSDIIELRTASTITRPLRLGYIVNRQTEFSVVRQVLQYNCSVWGGKFNLFVPTDGEEIREDWWRMLHYHDPDYVIFVGEIDQGLSQQVYNRLQPFWTYSWSDNWLQWFLENRNRIGAIPVIALLSKYHDSKGDISPEQSNYCYPHIVSSCFAPFLELTLGTYPPESDYQETFVHVLGASEIFCSAETLSDYLALLDRLDGRYTPLEFTGHYLRTSFELGGQLSPSLVVSDGTLDDLFLFHAARQSAFPLRGQPLVIVQIDEVQSESSVSELAHWLQDHTRGTLLDIASTSVDLDSLRSLRESLRPHLAGWQINLRRCNFDLLPPRVFHQERQRLITFRGRELSFELPEIEIADSVLSGTAWVTEIRQTALKMYKRGFAPSMFPRLNYLLSRARDPQWFQVFHGSPRRIARGELAIRANKQEHVAHFELPTDSELISAAFEDAGFKITYDEKGRYYESMVRLAGGDLQSTEFLQNRNIRQLMLKMRTGKGCTWSQMMGIIQPGRDAEKLSHLQDIVFELADKGILLRGVNLECPTCDLTTWYDFKALTERVECQGCRTFFQVALNKADFSYRANQLFIQGIDEGALTVLLTALLLFNSSEMGMIWKAGCRIASERLTPEVDLDLVAMCDGGLVVAECKDNLQKDFEKNPEKILEQLTRSVEAATQIHADLFILSTLNENAPAPVVDMVGKTAEADPQLNVLILRKSDLERGWMIEVTEEQVERRRFIQKFYKPLPSYQGECLEYDPKVSSGMIAFG